MRILKELLLNPIEAINRVKNRRDIDRIGSLFVIEWFLLGVANVIIYGNLGYLRMFSIGLTVFLAGIPIVLFFAFLLKIIITTLGGKGNYHRALASIVLGTFAISMGILLSSPFFYVPKVGFLFGLFILIVTGVLSLATFYRAVKELFGVDIMTAWIGIGLVAAGVTLGVYLTIILLLGGTPEFGQAFSALGTWNL
jgi:hypothetical protein